MKQVKHIISPRVGGKCLNNPSLQLNRKISFLTRFRSSEKMNLYSGSLAGYGISEGTSYYIMLYLNNYTIT